jgi:putative aldouronate transport system permease protein
MKRTTGEKIFEVFNYIFLTLLSIICVYPFLYVLAASLSSPAAVDSGKIFIIPDDFQLEAYKRILGNKLIWTSYANTFYYTFVGTVFSLAITVMGAYALSKKRLMGRKQITFFISLTLWFSAGLIPTYLNIRDFGLYNTRASLIIPFAINTFYVILMRTYFQSIPDEVEESAKIDGANDFVILWKIMVPLAIPAIATIGLYFAVNRWNGWFWASVLLKDENKIPLQLYLRKLIIQMSIDDSMLKNSDIEKVSQTTMVYGTIVVSIIPIVLLYPFIQKFFVKGIMVGSVKG